jgi:surfactin synthase thioesterase subunit
MNHSRYERHPAGFGLLRFGPRTADPARSLLAFPHGGGAPHSFAALSEHLPDGFAITAVDPPGRPRTGGRPLRELADLVDLYATRLPEHLLGGVLIGHSIGGYVASALAARLQRQGRPVRAVVMSAVVPPRYLDPGRPLSRMTDAQRLAWCRGIGTFPQDDKDGAALFEVFADAIRADCEAFESAVSVPMTHHAPLLVIGGDADPACPTVQVGRWVDTHPGAVIRILPGGHMLPQTAAARLAEEITAFLPAGGSAAGAGPAQPARSARAAWRREDLWLRDRDRRRRCLPVLVPRGHGCPARLGEVLAEAAAPLLAEHGALLARGWDVVRAEQLRAVAGTAMPYVGGNSPRTALGDGVYTSTEYPADAEISPHNELSYSASWPDRLYFACARPAAGGGQTPLVDGARLLGDPRLESFVDQLRRRGVRYARTLHAGRGPGRSWQDTFETDDRDRVRAILRAAGAEADWLPGDAVRIVQHRPAFLRHPRTGREVWFNQAEQWHHTALPAEVRDVLIEELGRDGLPHEATYGDGHPIARRHIDAVREVMAGAAVAHGWQRGDVLVVDNVATLHGRTPYRGERRVLVTMTGPAAGG